MPAETVPPITFREACRQARAKASTVKSDGSCDMEMLAVAEKGIARARWLLRTPPQIVELLMNRSREALAGDRTL